MIPVIYPLLIINGTHISFIKNSIVVAQQSPDYGELRFDVRDTIQLSTISNKFDNITLYFHQEDRYIFKKSILLTNIYFRHVGVCGITYNIPSCNHILG